MLTIALAQMDVNAGQSDANLARARVLCAQARDTGAELILLPELWLHGYDLAHAARWAAPVGDGGFAAMASLAQEFGLYVAGSTLECHEEGVSNTAAFYAPDGELLGAYRKVHLFRLMSEHHYLVPGNHLVLCDSPWGPVGLAICYDLRFPELFRALALAGAMLILVPAQWPTKRLNAWLLMVRARAAENELFVAACNRVGQDGDVSFPGQSLVANPLGEAVVNGDDRDRPFIARVDLDDVSAARRYLPVFEDRRPGAYRLAE
ncbi:MAG: carbon-nitrogen family hydrolase [Chloroflexi bacterium]|nr:carbon-nitrogen family hydrolase [Chloroflexota bacterium]